MPMEPIEFFVATKPLITIIHAFAGAIGIGTTTVTDTLFFKFLSDKIITKGEQETMEVVSKILWIALVVLIISGIFLFLSDPARYAASSKFLVKVCIVGVIFLNGILLSTYLGPRLQRLQFNTPTSRGQYKGFKKIAFISGVVSMSSWYAAFLLGLLSSIPLSFAQGLLVYIAVVCIGGVGSQLILKKFSQDTFSDEI